VKRWFLPVIVFSILLVVVISYTPSVDAAQEVRNEYHQLSGESGETITRTDGVSALATNTGTMHSWRTVQGQIAGWISPKTLDFGYMEPGEKGFDRDWFITIPDNTKPGIYEFTWAGSCNFVGGNPCDWVYNHNYKLEVKSIMITPPPTGASVPIEYVIVGIVIAAIVVGIGIAFSKRKKVAPAISAPPAKAQVIQSKDDTQFWVCPNCGNNTQMKDGRQYCSSCKIYLSI